MYRVHKLPTPTPEEFLPVLERLAGGGEEYCDDAKMILAAFDWAAEGRGDVKAEVFALEPGDDLGRLGRLAWASAASLPRLIVDDSRRVTIAWPVMFAAVRYTLTEGGAR